MHAAHSSPTCGPLKAQNHSHCHACESDDHASLLLLANPIVCCTTHGIWTCTCACTCICMCACVHRHACRHAHAIACMHACMMHACQYPQCRTLADTSIPCFMQTSVCRASVCAAHANSHYMAGCLLAPPSMLCGSPNAWSATV